MVELRSPLVAIGLRKSFGCKPLLNGVSLELNTGTLTYLCGLNGSGKSTLLDCLSGFDSSYSGQVWIGGKCVDGAPAERRAQEGLVRTFQQPHLYPDLTVGDHIVIGQHGSVPAVTALSIVPPVVSPDFVSALPIGDLIERRASELSFGEKKLVNLARAFATNPKVLLLDEPLASLHGARRQGIVDAILKRRRSGCALLVVEHDAPELLVTADATLELRDGRLRVLDER